MKLQSYQKEIPGDDLRKATKQKDKMKIVYGIALLLSLFLLAALRTVLTKRLC
jgi:hypothetical protein